MSHTNHARNQTVGSVSQQNSADLAAGCGRGGRGAWVASKGRVGGFCVRVPTRARVVMAAACRLLWIPQLAMRLPWRGIPGLGGRSGWLRLVLGPWRAAPIKRNKPKPPQARFAGPGAADGGRGLWCGVPVRFVTNGGCFNCKSDAAERKGHIGPSHAVPVNHLIVSNCATQNHA